MYTHLNDYEVIKESVKIWGKPFISDILRVDKSMINDWLKYGLAKKLQKNKRSKLINACLPPLRYQTQLSDEENFRFADLFAGIGGIRLGFEKEGGRCVFTSEWNAQAQRTYRANHYDAPDHVFNSDIREITEPKSVSEQEILTHIDSEIPDHDILLAGFPCQPFSIAGVSKKNSLGTKHGFDCKIQGTLFFDVCKVLQAKRPTAFVLENVKNLKSHNKGDTYKTILKALDAIGYDVPLPEIIDAKKFLPQHRERIVIVGLRKDLNIGNNFSLSRLKYPDSIPSLGSLLEKNPDPKYILSSHLWTYLQNYAAKHKQKGNGFGFGIVDENSIARTLSARYYKDGSEILVSRGQEQIPRRLTPRECARLMGFDRPGEPLFRIPVSDTQAYKQFGNSVSVPVFEAVAQTLCPDVIKVLQEQSVNQQTMGIAL